MTKQEFITAIDEELKYLKGWALSHKSTFWYWKDVRRIKRLFKAHKERKFSNGLKKELE